MELPVSRVLAFGECQGLCGLSEGDVRHPETPQRRYTAASPAGAWLVVQSKAAAGEYHEEVNGEFGHISDPSPISQGSSPFPISNATQEDAGPYSCHYLAGGTVLARSETLEIMVEGEGCALTSSRGVRLHTDARSHLASPSAWWAGFFPSSLACRGGDHLYLCLSEVVGSWRSHLLMPSSLPIEFHLPKPVLSVLPGLEVAAGAYVTFRCTITHASAGCFLYLEGQDKALDLLPKDQDDFNLSRVHKGNEGRYSCQCFTKGALWNWSDVSNSLDLVVKGETSSPAASNSSLPLLPHPGRTRKEDAEEGTQQCPLVHVSVCPGSPTCAPSVPLGPLFPLWEGSLWGSPVTVPSCPLQITPGATWCAWPWALPSSSCWGSLWPRTGTATAACGSGGRGGRAAPCAQSSPRLGAGWEHWDSSSISSQCDKPPPPIGWLRRHWAGWERETSWQGVHAVCVPVPSRLSPGLNNQCPAAKTSTAHSRLLL
uniref:Ig-like domain-containing protein n=1 Tax=Strigops habroptila TaxID=2489341 RepID=A0A672U2B0_STRHB